MRRGADNLNSRRLATALLHETPMCIAKAKTGPGHRIRRLTDMEKHASVSGRFVVPENVTLSGTGSGADTLDLRDHTP